MTFEDTGHRLAFMLEGLPFWSGHSLAAGNTGALTEVILRLPDLFCQNSLLNHRGNLNALPRPAPKACGEQP
jgi:hypothetical protein